MAAKADESGAPVPRTGGRLLAWLQLMRLPTVFTAMSNILCGYLITHTEPRLKIDELFGHSQLWLLLISSAGLYLGGMVLNDVFDARLDAVERPERPIPSGRISLRSAATFGALLMIMGVAAAALAGTPSLLIAGLIVPAVVAYDVFLKSTPAAPFGMATCRFLNLMLGASAVEDLDVLWAATPVTVAAGLAVYILGVTVFARNEAGDNTRSGLAFGIILVISGLAIDAWLAGKAGATPGSINGSRMALLLLALNLLMRAAAVLPDPQPGRIQRTVGLMLLSIIFLDAIMVFALTADAKLSALVIGLMAPASLLRRFIPMS